MSRNSRMLNSSPSPQEAAREFLRRKAARQNLQAFTEYVTPNWRAGKIHRAVCEQLERVRRKEIDRLLLLCPPQHGKSELTSRKFPAYLLGHDPTLDIIAASATAELAEGFGRDVRNLVLSSEYRVLFPETTLSEDSQARGRWSTAQGGSYYAVGVGGQLFGHGGMAIIDDPFGSWEDAQSETSRDSVWDWYTGTLYNRVRPGQPIIMIQHRMHEEDLAGHAIEQMKRGKDCWEIVELPALLDDPPWPERYDRAALERIRTNTDPRQWSALYLQNPVPEEGTFFKREWARWYSEPPQNVAKYCTSDFAVTEGGGDYTEIWTDGVDPQNNLYLGLSAYSGQTTADVWIEQLIHQFRRHKPFTHFGESGVIRRAIEPVLTRRMHETGAYCRLEWITRTRDKAATARALQARMAMGKVYLPDNEHGHRLLAQMLAFPAGMHDDAVDAAALMALALDQAHPGILPVVEVQKQRDPYESDDEDEELTWRTA
jgi:predicted phage terminase large subunit-like protein